MTKNKAPMKSVGALINENMPPAFLIAYKLGEIENKWKDIAGPALALRSRPVSMDRQGLVVICESPAAAQMLNMQTGSLLRRISRLFGIRLSGVRVVVARVAPRKKAEVKQVRTTRVPKSYVEEAFERIRLVIDDTELAMSIAKAEATARASKEQFGLPENPGTVKQR